MPSRYIAPDGAPSPPDPWGARWARNIPMSCIFCMIVAGEVPSERVYEDDWVLGIRDVAPQAPTHVLVLPKVHVASMLEMRDEVLAGKLLFAASEVARGEGLESGWRLITNTGSDGGQEVDHLHLHVLGGRPLGRMLEPSRESGGADRARRAQQNQ